MLVNPGINAMLGNSGLFCTVAIASVIEVFPDKFKLKTGVWCIFVMPLSTVSAVPDTFAVTGLVVSYMSGRP